MVLYISLAHDFEPNILVKKGQLIHKFLRSYCHHVKSKTKELSGPSPERNPIQD